MIGALTGNADREMLKLLVQTRAAALEQLQEAVVPPTRRSIIGHTIGRIVGRGPRQPSEEDKLQALRGVTGLLPTRSRQLIDAAGINGSYEGHTAADCDLSSVDFTGAGLQRIA